MCGIFGAIGNPIFTEIEAAISTLNHRGPDNVSVERISDSTIFAHSRLSIIDLSIDSNQPIWDSSRKVCITFNGEIYNYKNLRQNLVALGYKFNSSGDAEVLVNLFIEYGMDFLDMVDGIFSFAIFDSNSGNVFIARDPFGVKPLYYTICNDTFYFSSEIKSFLKIKDFDRTLNLETLYKSLVFLWAPGNETLFSTVNKVENGHYLIIDKELNTDVIEYWNFPSYNPNDDSSSVIEQKLYDLLNKSVSSQLVSDVEVGAFLSGGLDSSLLVALSTEKLKHGINCFTIDTGKSDDFIDDLPFARKVSKIFGSKLNIIPISSDISEVLPDVIYGLDELHADPAAINTFLISRLASEKGIKVLFSGAGGDDIFTGYRRHLAVKNERFWSWLPLSFRKLIKYITSLLPIKFVIFRRIKKAFQYADLTNDERLLSYFYWMDPDKAASLFKHSSNFSSNNFSFMLSNITSKCSVEKILDLEKKYFLIDHNFSYTDKMSMANSVEVRVPFLNRAIVNMASTIPVDLKLNGNTGKYILKKVSELILPKDIIYRKKTGFGAPLRQWLNNDLSELVDTCLSYESINNRGIFDYNMVQEIIKLDRSGKEDYSYTIYSLLCFEIWCQQFLD